MEMRTIVLIGIGHTHAHVVRQWTKSPPGDARLVCISPFPVATYSGMVPGTLARLYDAEQMQIELEPLCRAAHAELYLSPATAIDCVGRQIQLASGEALGYDYVSIGIGSVPQAAGIEITSGAGSKVKPMQTLLDRVDQRLASQVERCRQEARQLRVAIVGGGAAGVEIAFCLSRRIEIDYPQATYRISLLDSHRTLLAAEHARTQRLVRDLLRDRGVHLILEQRAHAVRPGIIELGNGQQLPADVVIWAAGAAPPSLLKQIDLPKDDAGFLLTRHTLQSTGNPCVFAVGDCGTIAGETYAKAGVYAVRQGPVLWHNLQAVLAQGPLKEFHPQQKFLRLFNMGDGRAILDYRGWVTQGRWCWWLKDWIDRRFVGQYQMR